MAALDDFMRLAFAQAEEALDAGEVPIGCVFVDRETGTVIGSARNMTNETLNATKHAELVAINHIYETKGDIVDWSKVDLYVTVEPCIMCAAALRLLGVRRAFFGTRNDRFGGCGSIISAHENFMPPNVGPLEAIPVESWRKRCVLALRRFYMRHNERAPKPKCKRNRVLKDEDL